MSSRSFAQLAKVLPFTSLLMLLMNLPLSTAQIEIQNQRYFTIEKNGIKPIILPFKIDQATSTVEWSKPNEAVLASYAPDTVERWRLTEINLRTDRDTKKQTFSGSSTTFYSGGMRSKTICEGEADTTPSCVSASRKLCAVFKKQSAAMKQKLFGDGGKSEIVNLGRQCSDFAGYLQGLSPESNLSQAERTERDTAVVEKDIEAIRDLKKRARNNELQNLDLKGMESYWSETKVGASVSGMKNRANRLKEVSHDFVMLSKLAAMCADIDFETPPGGLGWTLPKSSKKKVIH